MSWISEIDDCINKSSEKINNIKNVATKTITRKPRIKKIENKAVKQSIKNIDYKRKTALVQSKTGKIYPVTLSDQALAKNVTETDIAIVRKVNNYWIMIDVEKPTTDETSTSELFTEDFEWCKY